MIKNIKETYINQWKQTKQDLQNKNTVKKSIIVFMSLLVYMSKTLALILVFGTVSLLFGMIAFLVLMNFVPIIYAFMHTPTSQMPMSIALSVMTGAGVVIITAILAVIRGYPALGKWLDKEDF